MICGGLDVGGTKIEARLFHGPEFDPGVGTRWATPRADYGAFVAKIAEAGDWLMEQAGQENLPIGLAMAGPIDDRNGASLAVNTPAKGHRVGVDLSDHLGMDIPMLNDCVAFTLSETHGGAGAGARSVVGVTFGTGLGAGHFIDGEAAPRLGNHALEIGHIGVSARLAARHNLPDLRCGCGEIGCLEAYLSASGLAHLARAQLGRDVSIEHLAEEPSAAPVLSTWFEIVAEALRHLYLILAPDLVVLGGGLSQMPGFAARARSALSRGELSPLPLPEIALSRFGGASGARGAAILAGRSACA